MTNEEKAKEIIAVSNANIVYDIVDFKALREAQMDDLLEMAEWKDEQYAKALTPILIELDELKQQIKSLLP